MRPERPLPPGRFGLPWVGESLSIVRSNHGFYTDRFAKYGPVFKTRLFGIDFVVFSGHEAFHAFATDSRIERGGADPVSVEQLFLNSLALLDGSDHRLRKAVMLRAVGFRSAIEAYLPRMQALMESMVERWVQRGDETVLPELQMFAARLSGALYTGDESEEAAQELNRVVADMRGGFQTIPFPIPGTPYARAIRARNRLIQIVDEAVARHQTSDNYDDIVSRMLVAASESGVDADELKGDIRHLVFASQGGYFVPLTLLTMALGQHPEIVAKARAEIDRIAPSGQLTMDQIDELEYLEQITKEVRRYFAMNSATFFGRVKKPMEVAGYRIPAGWGAIGAIHINMRNEDVFEEPDRFDPDRFEADAEAALPPGSYVPHGGGLATHHRCPGENIVTVAMKMYLVLLLRRATWTLPPQDLELTNELFPLPSSGLVVNFHAHAPVSATA